MCLILIRSIPSFILSSIVDFRFTRMFSHLRHLDYSTRLDMLGLWSLEERSNRADLIEVFKIMKGYTSICVGSLFEPIKDIRTRGHSLKLAKHRTDKDLRHYFFSERVVNRWYQLDEDTIEASTLNSFKNHLTKLRARGWASSWTAVCRARRLDQVFHLVQPHQVYDQVYVDGL